MEKITSNTLPEPAPAKFPSQAPRSEPISDYWAACAPSIYNMERRIIPRVPGTKYPGHNRSRTPKHFFQNQLGLFCRTDEGMVEWQAMQRVVEQVAAEITGPVINAENIALAVILKLLSIESSFQEDLAPKRNTTIIEMLQEQLNSVFRAYKKYAPPNLIVAEPPGDETEDSAWCWGIADAHAAHRIMVRFCLARKEGEEHNDGYERVMPEVITYLVYRLYMNICEDQQKARRRKPEQQSEPTPGPALPEAKLSEKQNINAQQVPAAYDSLLKYDRFEVGRLTNKLQGTKLAVSAKFVIVTKIDNDPASRYLTNLPCPCHFDELCEALHKKWERKINIDTVTIDVLVGGLGDLKGYDVGMFKPGWGTKHRARISNQVEWDILIDDYLTNVTGTVWLGLKGES